MKFDVAIFPSGFINVDDGIMVLAPGDDAFWFNDRPWSRVTVELPDGYELAQNTIGEWRIWKQDGTPMDILAEGHGERQKLVLITISVDSDFARGWSKLPRASIVDGKAVFAR